ncbi:MAG: 50S ribosomal protein L32 [Chloroflexota bacterium]
MGALPKGKTSHARKNSRRSHDKASFGAIVLCAHCRHPHLTHRVCANCGYYAGREVVPQKTDVTA